MNIQEDTKLILDSGGWVRIFVPDDEWDKRHAQFGRAPNQVEKDEKVFTLLVLKTNLFKVVSAIYSSDWHDGSGSHCHVRYEDDGRVVVECSIKLCGQRRESTKEVFDSIDAWLEAKFTASNY